MFCDFPIAQLDYSFDANQVTQSLFPFSHVEISPNVITVFQAQPDSAHAAIHMRHSFCKYSKKW
jgi:hypothetical protein